jgi:hypothetical protein
VGVPHHFETPQSVRGWLERIAPAVENVSP